MWRQGLFLLGIVLILQVAPPRASAEPTGPVRGGSQLSQGPGTVIDNGGSLAQAPLNLFWSIATAPLTIVQSVIHWGTGIIWDYFEAALCRIWGMTRNYVIPQLDKTAMEIAASDSAPPRMRTMLMSLHSTYAFMKLFGYMRPTP